MPDEDSHPERREGDVERLVRRAVRDHLSSPVGKILWTILSGFALLVGFQLLRFWLLESSGGVGLVMLAALIVCSSLYLLYLLYGRIPMEM